MKTAAKNSPQRMIFSSDDIFDDDRAALKIKIALSVANTYAARTNNPHFGELAFRAFCAY